MDALSELLRVVKLSGAMFLDARCTAPWAVRSPPAEKFRPYLRTQATHIMEFHLVAAGAGWVRIGEETTRLSAGDVVMIPHGDAHVMGNGDGAPVVDGEQSLPVLLERRIHRPSVGGGGAETRLVCGYLLGDARLLKPALAGLPRVVRVALRDDASGRWLENAIHHAVDQAQTDVPGSDVILARLAEMLFAEALRRYVLQLPAGRTNWLAGAADPAVGRALAALHRDPGRDWSLDDLAQLACLSRSALADRFARFIGQGPIAYLTEWRLELAAEALRSSRRPVIEVAKDVGYASEAAFNRAFKRRFALPPAAWRRARLAN